MANMCYIMYSARHNVRYCICYWKPSKIDVPLEHLADKIAVELEIHTVLQCTTNTNSMGYRIMVRLFPTNGHFLCCTCVSGKAAIHPSSITCCSWWAVSDLQWSRSPWQCQEHCLWHGPTSCSLSSLRDGEL